MFKWSNVVLLLKNYWQVFLIEGLSYTLIFSAISVFFGVILGTLIAFGRMSDAPFRNIEVKDSFTKWLSKFNPLSLLCEAYTEVIRGTPLLLQLYFFVLVMPKVIPGGSTFTWVAVALSFNSAAYVSELVRSGVQAVDKGQTEAARSLGMNKSQTMMKVVIPQAIKNILPAIGNEFVSITKETSMASTFFVGELMTSYLKVKGATYLVLESLLIIAVIYFLLTFVLSKLIGRYEKRLNSK